MFPVNFNASITDFQKEISRRLGRSKSKARDEAVSEADTDDAEVQAEGNILTLRLKMDDFQRGESIRDNRILSFDTLAFLNDNIEETRDHDHVKNSLKTYQRNAMNNRALVPYFNPKNRVKIKT